MTEESETNFDPSTKLRQAQIGELVSVVRKRSETPAIIAL